MATQFNPMRSLIYTDVVREQYRHKLLHWLHYHHVQDSISQFGPYVTKYAFYQALPTPPEGERFGTCRMQLTEHYWLLDPFAPELRVKTFTEVMPLEVMKWQGSVPDTDEVLGQNMEGDAARSTGGNNGMPPFLFAFVPVWWEEDIKGRARTVLDGPNYRWQFCVRYPDSVDPDEGDRWLLHEMLPAFREMPEVTRILTSKILRDVNRCPFHRVVEMWFEGPEEWHRAAVEQAAGLSKPRWAQTDRFPYLTPMFHIKSLFLPDMAYSDNLVNHTGWITMR